MQYIKSTLLDDLNDNAIVYVNRNVFNSTMAKYEISMDNYNYIEELNILLSLWKKTYKLEKETKRIISFIEMRNGDVKKCFKNYKSLPKGSFGIIKENGF